MAAATLAVEVSAAEVTVAGGVRQLVLVLVSTEAATAVPLNDATKTPDPSRPSVAKAMTGTALTLNFDDSTGVITSLT